MADNIDITPGSGRTIAADLVAGALVNRIKWAHGPDGSATDVSDESPLPVTLPDTMSGKYETVAAAQTDQVLGATGAAGDYLVDLLVVPATTSPGAVQIKDGSGSAITVFAGGTNSVNSLLPFTVPLGVKSQSGAWKVTTGNNASVIANGRFT